MSSGSTPAGTPDFPAKVDAYIVRKGNTLAVVDSDGPGARPLNSLMVHYDGEIEWHCDLGPWEVLRKTEGKNPFKNGNGVKGGRGQSEKTPMCAKQNPELVVCGYSVAVWDEGAQDLLLIDPDIVVGPPY